jgi:hypothetical protein
VPEPNTGSELPALMILEDISETGARLVGSVPVAPGTTVIFDVPGTSLRRSGVVRHVQALQSQLSVLFSMGVSLTAMVSLPAQDPMHDSEEPQRLVS